MSQAMPPLKSTFIEAHPRASLAAAAAAAGLQWAAERRYLLSHQQRHFTPSLWLCRDFQDVSALMDNLPHLILPLEIEIA
jgi:hypothetical protein